MGVRIIIGREQGDSSPDTRAVLVDSSTGSAFGPLFVSWQAEEQAEAFLAWFSEQPWLSEIPPPVPVFRPSAIARGGDPRLYPDRDLETLYQLWRSRHINDDGELIAKEVRNDDDGD